MNCIALHCIASHRIVLLGTAARDGQASGGKQGVAEEAIKAAGVQLCFSPLGELISANPDSISTAPAKRSNP